MVCIATTTLKKQRVYYLFLFDHLFWKFSHFNETFHISAAITIEIGCAVRYAHSSCEVADTADIENLSVLVAGIAGEIDSTFKQARY